MGMIEVYPGLYVGSDADFQPLADPNSPTGVLAHWAVVHACKEPYHRQAVGYTQRGCPKDNPEYLYAVRGNRLCLNMIDAPTAELIPRRLIDASNQFIYRQMKHGNKVLVHCNQGHSRAPGLALAYLGGSVWAPMTFVQAMQRFEKLYPPVNLGSGVLHRIRMDWPHD